jgi:hypothetical protein
VQALAQRPALIDQLAAMAHRPQQRADRLVVQAGCDRADGPAIDIARKH